MARLKLLLIAALAASIAVILINQRPQPAPIPQVTIATVLPQPQQTLKGWGIYPCTFQLDRPNAENYHIFNQPNAQRLIFKELGFNILRCNILPHSYDAKKDDGSLDTAYLDASLVRHLAMGRHYGISKYLLTVWSPPAPFKDPPVTVGIDPKTHREAHLRPDREAAYGRYVVKVLYYLTKTKGFPPPIAYSIQNEPSFAPPLWDGTKYESAQWQRVFKSMRRALDGGGYRDVALVGPECGSYSDSVDFMGGPQAPALNDPEFARAMSGFAFHGYTFLSRRNPHPQNLRAVALAAKAKGKDIWMTEYCVIAVPRTPLDHTLEVTQHLGREMAYIPSNYWFWWQGWYYQHPKGEVLITGVDDNHLHISKTYYVLQKLWHSVPPGSVVKRVETNNPEISGYDPTTVQTVAFDHDGQQTILFVNPTTAPKPLLLKGLSGSRATAFLTDDTHDMAAQPTHNIISNEIHLALPARSVILVVTKNDAPVKH